MLRQTLQRLWAKESFSTGLRVFIALAGAMLAGILEDRNELIIPLFLGIIASALAETDDNWRGRLQALLVTLVCFGIAALAVELLFPYPWLFLAGLCASSFSLILLGAVGGRYASIAQATLILSVYSMIGVEQRGGATHNFWHEPLVLVSGAAWYGLLSVLWCALFTHQPLQQSLARLYLALGDYLKMKSALFEPVRDLDVEAGRLDLARQNGRVVNALNQAKDMLLHRLGSGRPTARNARYLRLYFAAQDIHERASSSHYPYHALAAAFFHSDVMFRCQRLLEQQGRACKALARTLPLRQPFDYDNRSQGLEDLQAAIEHLRAQNNPAWRHLLRSLTALASNLSTLDRKLAEGSLPEGSGEVQDITLFDRSPRSLREAVQRIRLQFTPTSLIFRHALRMSLALATGYGVLHAIHPSQGYWILLTTVFVCQPNYGATRTRLVQRILGTVAGLVAGWALITLFPNLLLQAVLAVIAGVIFFTNRGRRYTLSTAAITTMVLFCFNQIGDGYGLIVPRLADTLIGAAIAGAAVFLILPDWQGRRLNRMFANTLESNARYLRKIMQQYETGKRDDLDYRITRRNAHNADAALSTTLSNMLLEPGHFRKDAEMGFRFLLLSHTLLSYLSALGAHRESLPDDHSDALIDAACERIAGALESIAAALAEGGELDVHDEEEEALATRLEELPEDLDDAHRLIQTQLALICRQLAPLRTLAAHLLRPPPTADSTHS